jgi:uncharacterized repeat protein (TIGR02543 family)
MESVALGGQYTVRPSGSALEPQWPLTDNYADGVWRNGHFKEWNLAPDGSSTSYAAGDVFNLVIDALEFYAQWENWIDYDANEGELNTVPTREAIRHGDAYAVNRTTASPTSPALGAPTRTGFDFIGWSTTKYAITLTSPAVLADVFDGQYYGSVLQDMKFYAVWEIHHYRVIFTDGYTDGYNTTDPAIDGPYSVVKDWQDVPYGGAAIAPDNPTRDGFRFIRWDKAYDYITGDLVVWAVWEEVQIAPPGPNPEPEPQPTTPAIDEPDDKDPTGGAVVEPDDDDDDRDDDQDDDQDDDNDGDGGSPDTGDDSLPPQLWLLIMATALAILVALARRLGAASGKQRR